MMRYEVDEDTIQVLITGKTDVDLCRRQDAVGPSTAATTNWQTSKDVCDALR